MKQMEFECWKLVSNRGGRRNALLHVLKTHCSLSLSHTHKQTQRQRTDWFDLSFCGPLPQPQLGTEDQSTVSASSAQTPPSRLSFDIQILQIGFNVCFALPVIDKQSCVAN